MYWFVSGALVVCALGVVNYLLPYLIKIISRDSLTRRVRSEDISCLTFDDGPDPESTPVILDLLKNAGIRATFFMIGSRIEQYPDLVRRVFREGHVIGEHSYSHYHAWKSGPWTTYRDLNRGRQALHGLVSGSRTEFLRPPHGKLNLGTLLYAIVHRRKLIFWDVDPKDYAATSASEIVSAIKPGLAGGHVILLHDGRMRTGENAHLTVEAIRELLEGCARPRERFQTVRDLIDPSVRGQSPR